MTIIQRRDSLVVSASLLTLICGAAIVVSPTWLHFPSAAIILNYLTAGLAICLLAALRVFVAHRAYWLSLTNVALGCWVVISPFVLGFRQYPWGFWTSVIFGTGVIVFSLWSFWIHVEPSLEEL